MFGILDLLALELGLMRRLNPYSGLSSFHHAGRRQPVRYRKPMDRSIRHHPGTVQQGEDRTFNYLRGTRGRDEIHGGYKATNHIDGKQGSDVIYGGKKADNHLKGGFGDDTIYGGKKGTNHIEGGFGDDKLHGGYKTKEDKIFGGSGDDEITAGNRSKLATLDGGSGDDTMTGGENGKYIFKPGTGDNHIKTKAGSQNYVDLSTDGNKYGRNYIDGTEGAVAVNVYNYKGPGSTLNLNENDKVQFDPYKGIGDNVHVIGDPEFQPLFITA